MLRTLALVAGMYHSSTGDGQKLIDQDLHQDLLQGDVEEIESAGGDPEWDDLKSLVWMEVRETHNVTTLDGQLLEFSSYYSYTLHKPWY